MATFAISLSVEVEAEDYDQACDIRDKLFKDLMALPEVLSGPYEIDVEQQDGFDDEVDEEVDED